MDSRSVQCVSFNVRSPITIHLPCLSFLCYACYVFTVSPPLNLRYTPLLPLITPLPPTTTSSTTVPLPSSFQASSATSHLPHIAYLSIFICCTRHMLLLHYNPILLHSYHCRPLITFRYHMLPILNNIYSSGPCALLVIG